MGFVESVGQKHVAAWESKTIGCIVQSSFTNLWNTLTQSSSLILQNSHLGPHHCFEATDEQFCASLFHVN